MSDLKQQAALAAVKMIKENSIVGFGAGSTIAHLVNGIKTMPNLWEMDLLDKQKAIFEHYGFWPSGWKSKITKKGGQALGS